MITFTNLSGASEIGSHSYLVEIDDTRIVLDAGMHPKKEGNAAKPQYELIGERSPDAIFVTHSHLDHIGTLPVVQEKYPQAEVYMTNGTFVIGSAMLHNSVNVMTSKRTQDGIVEYPFYTHSQLDDVSREWIARDYKQNFRLGKKDGVLASLHDAGHILGSCGVRLESPSGKSIFYTGDVQFNPQSLIPGADFPTSDIDILVMECTHGATPTDTSYTREKELLRLAKAIRETLAINGIVLIPVFALGKSQELLYEIEQFRKKGLIPNVPIHFGGLSTKVTLLYDKLADTTPRRLPGYRLRESIDISSLPRKNKKPLVASPGNIYLVSSGMMSEHTASNKIAAQVLPRKQDSILFVGYSDPDSPAGWLKEAKAGESVRLKEKGGQTYPYNCRTERFSFSGHASRNALLDYACRLKPSTIMLVHGDPAASAWMKSTLEEMLPDSQIIIPEPGQSYNIS